VTHENFIDVETRLNLLKFTFSFILLNKYWTRPFKIIITQIAGCPAGRRLSRYNRLVLFPAQFGETPVRSRRRTPGRFNSRVLLQLPKFEVLYVIYCTVWLLQSEVYMHKHNILLASYFVYSPLLNINKRVWRRSAKYLVLPKCFNHWHKKTLLFHRVEIHFSVMPKLLMVWIYRLRIHFLGFRVQEKMENLHNTTKTINETLLGRFFIGFVIAEIWLRFLNPLLSLN